MEKVVDDYIFINVKDKFMKIINSKASGKSNDYLIKVLEKLYLNGYKNLRTLINFYNSNYIDIKFDKHKNFSRMV